MHTCVYKEGNNDSYGTYWHSTCGNRIYCSIEIEVGFSCAPLPTERGEYCPKCGGKIQLVPNHKGVTK